MERIDVIYQAAIALRQRLATPKVGTPQQGTTQGRHANELVEQLCTLLGIELNEGAHCHTMLGGAFSRLQLLVWSQPEVGGDIWLRPNLPPEKRAFAIAHELGHYILHRGEGQPLHSACTEAEVNETADPNGLHTSDHQVEEYTPRARRELEANAFAAELLAPRREIRWLFATNPQATPVWLAAHLGISPALARQRLVDAVLSASAPETQEAAPKSGTLAEAQASTASAAHLLAHLDRSQQEAARASTPALVIAGPGTGKTATLVGRVAHLIVERGLPPERVLALTFSNRAAGEMRERLLRHGLPGERMPVMTMHAFAASLLREYAAQVPCGPGEPKFTPDFRILDQSDGFLLMEELLGELPLFYYRSLSNPTAHVRTLFDDFSHARDTLLAPEDYLALVEAMPLLPGTSTDILDDEADTLAEEKRRGTRPTPPSGTYTREQIARACERALAYGVWDRALRQRGLVDFGGLIQRAVELLHANAQVYAEVRQRYAKVLIDEFQDTNFAAAELLFLAAGERSQELWVVGDRNQSIYRWRGASPSNLNRLARHFPTLQVYTLRRSYRSVPAIVQLGSYMAARMAELSPGALTPSNTYPPQLQPGTENTLQQALLPVTLEPHRQAEAHPAVLQSTFINAAHESLGLAAAIQKHHLLGFGYSDQAILCRSHRQAYRIAATLAAEGIPVRQMGDFFERPEIKDVLALLEVAAGPGPQGLLRGEMLLLGMGYLVSDRAALATVVRSLAAQHTPIPQALNEPTILAGVAGLPPGLQSALVQLGEVAQRLRRSSPVESAISKGLADFLLAPRGYAWYLMQVADGRVTLPSEGDTETPQPAVERRRAQGALAALGELIRLAARFDLRWQQEPTFRERLSRAVAHWQQSAGEPQPITMTQRQGLSDVLGSIPGADVSEDDAAATATPAGSARAVPTASSVRCFLHYLDALRAADALIPVPATADDAVHVLTLHASKGLEFPVVYLPGLEQGSFPPSPNHREEAAPPGFREVNAPGEQEAEERCLFYVGATRARDMVAFTHATSDKRGKKQPSSLLALVEGALAAEDVHPLLPDEERAALAARAITLPNHDEESDLEQPEPALQPTAEAMSAMAATGKRTYTLRELEQYLECPRQYKYSHRYALADPAMQVVYRFHRAVRRGLGLLRQMQTTRPLPQWATIEQQFRADWETEGPVGHAYGTFYWEHARGILRHEWKKLAEATHTPTPGAMLVAEPLQVELNRCTVRVTADQVIQVPSATSGTPIASSAVLTRLHTGRPHKEDADDLRLPLYFLGYEQQHPTTPVRIELAYLGDTLTDVSPDLALRLQGDVLDATHEARKAADAYRKPGRKARSRLDKLDEAAAGIEAGKFDPKPEVQRCRVCPYCYVCPADPEAS